MQKAAAAASIRSTKEKNAVNEVQPAAFFTLKERGCTAMQKLLEATAPVCCIYDVHFRDLVDEDDSDIGK